MKNRKFFVLLCFILSYLFLFSSCGKKQQEVEGSCTYNDLYDSQKKIIDLVYDNYSSWKEVQDSGKKFSCTNVSFYYEGNTLIFAPCYKASTTYYDGGKPFEGSYFYFVRFMQIDLSEQLLYAYKYSVVESSREKVADMIAFNGEPFDVSADKEMAKNVLAKEYYNSILKSNSN